MQRSRTLPLIIFVGGVAGSDPERWVGQACRANTVDLVARAAQVPGLRPILVVTPTDGWQDELEASAGWRSTVVVLDGAEPERGSESAGLDAFADGQPDGDAGGDSADEPESSADASTDGPETFTGTVVQPGDPVILDSGDETVHVETDADVHLGQEITVRGHREGETFVAEDVF